MPTFVIDTNVTWRLECVHPSGVLSPQDQFMSSILPVLADLNAASPVLELLFRDIGGDPNKYRYRLTLQDGRVFEQVMTFVSMADLDPGSTFDLTGAWKLSELVPQRILRSLCIEIRKAYQITRLQVTYPPLVP